MRETRPTRPGRVRPLVVALIAIQGCDGPLEPAPLPGDDSPVAPGVAVPADQEPPPGATELPGTEVDTLFLSSVSGFTDRHRTVVESASAWAETWSRLTGTVEPSAPMPEVDFSRRLVLVLAMGSRPTGGYLIEVSPLRIAEDVLYVPARETSPGPTCATTQATTQPAVAVSIRRQGIEEVVFLDETAVYDCG